MLLVPTLYYGGHGTLAIGLGALALAGLVARKHDIGAQARRWMRPAAVSVAATAYAGPGVTDEDGSIAAGGRR